MRPSRTLCIDKAIDIYEIGFHWLQKKTILKIWCYKQISRIFDNVSILDGKVKFLSPLELLWLN